jgi:hypothetical protein
MIAFENNEKMNASFENGKLSYCYTYFSFEFSLHIVKPAVAALLVALDERRC